MRQRRQNDKVDLWVARRRVCALPAMDLGVSFKPQKFSSHAAMNRWKHRLLMQIAERGGVTWKQ